MSSGYEPAAAQVDHEAWRDADPVGAQRGLRRRRRFSGDERIQFPRWDQALAREGVGLVFGISGI